MASPAAYVSTNDLQKKWVLQITDDFAEDLNKISGKCMDIGCGPGDVTRNILLPSLNPDATIIGTDISKIMIEYANNSYVDSKRIEFEVLNMETTNLPKKYVSEFDHLFSFHAVHWCKDIRQAFQNMYDILRPGGTMLIALLKSYDTLEVCCQFLKQDIRTAPYMRYNRAYLSPFHSSTRPCEELKELLNDIGFTVHHCDHQEMTLTVKDVEGALSSLISLVLNKISCDEKEELKEDFKHVYEEARVKYRGDDPRFCINGERNQMTIIDSHTLLIVYAQKSMSELYK